MRWRVAFAIVFLAGAAVAVGCRAEPRTTRGFYAEVRVEVDPSSDDSLAAEGVEERTTLVRWWYASDPDRWRFEIGLSGAPLDEGTALTVFDGAESWYYDDRSNAYVHDEVADLPPGTVMPPLFSAPVGPATVESIEAFMEQWRQRGAEDVRIAGTESVLGRPTQVVEMRPAWRGASSSATAPEPGGTAASTTTLDRSGGMIRAYVDPERMFVMRWEVDGGSEGQSYRSEVTRLDYDTGVDVARFAFTPPSGATDVTERSAGPCSSSSGPVGGAGIPAQPGFLRPSYVPPGFVSTGSGSESGMTCDIDATWVTLKSSTGGSLVLLQRRRVDVPRTIRGWERVDVDGRPAYRSTEDGLKRLVWADGEVVAMLQSDSLPFEELLRMAASAAVSPGPRTGAS